LTSPRKPSRTLDLQTSTTRLLHSSLGNPSRRLSHSGFRFRSRGSPRIPNPRTQNPEPRSGIQDLHW
jgi:hypothetical protein